MTNVNLPPTSKWAEYLEHIYIDEETGASFIIIDGENQPLTTPAVESMVAALDHIAIANANSGCNDRREDSLFEDTEFNEDQAEPSCLIPIVHVAASNEILSEACLQAALKHPSPPFVFTDVSGSRHTPELVNDQTLVVTIDNRGEKLSHLHVEVDQRNLVVRNHTMYTIDLKNLPSEYKDNDYIKDMMHLRALADQALANDPVVGRSGFMPLTKSSVGAEWRMCMGGECPIGNLFADALHWAGDTDFAVLPSGGLRGEGWPAGDVHVSDIWAALPFVNHLCTGVISGVSIFKLLNYSTSVATFQSTKTEMGDRLLQMSGMKMSYNTQLKGSGLGRLMSVDVWDSEKGDYLPLERLKMYTFATDNWMCDQFDPYPSIFKPELIMKGEIRGTVDESRPVQDIVGAYLTGLNATYETSLRGSHLNDTEAFEPMAFVQTPESCLIDQYWEGVTLSCKSCPGGKYVKFSEDLVSFLSTPDSGELTGRNVLSNKELFNVTLAPKSIPAWVVLKESTKNMIKGSMILQPGESIAIDFDIDVSALGKGTTRRGVSFGVVLDGDYPGCLTDLDITFDTAVEVRSDENFNHLGAIRASGLTLMALAMGLSIAFSIWTYKQRKHRIVKLSQPTFLHIICAGVFIMASCIVPLSIDDGIASWRGCDIACMSTPWLFSMGFAITFSALFAKIWRVHKVISAAKRMRRVEVHEKEALKPIVGILLLNVLLLLCWTFIDPLRWNRESINDDPTNTYGFCKSEGRASIAFQTLLILLNGAALLVACIQAYRARQLDDEYTESRWLAIACASWIQVLIVGVPVIILTGNQPTASYFTRTAVVFLVCVSMLLLLFVPKIKMAKAMPVQPKNSSQVYQPSGMATPDQAAEATTVDRRNSALNKIVSWKPETNRTSTMHTSSNEDELKQRICELEKLLRESTKEERAQGSTSKTTETLEEDQKESEEDEYEDPTGDSQV